MPRKEGKPSKQKKDPAAVALGRKGGLKGGKARMAQLSKEERVKLTSKAGKARAEALTAKRRAEIARSGAKARWNRED